MNEKIICEKCGNEMVSFIRGSSCGVECLKCGWGLATTYIEPIKTDETNYTLSIPTISEPNIDHIKAISNILNVNFIRSKSLLQEGNASITDKAVKIRDYARLLNEKAIQFTITPDFPYEI